MPLIQHSYFEFEPSPALAPLVRVIWGVRGGTSYDREAVLPNGVIELMINFGPRQKVLAYGDRRVDEDYVHAWLAGIQDRPLTIGSPDGCDHMGIRFRPGGAHAFFDLPMHAVTNQVVVLDLLLGAEADALRDRLAEAPNDRARAGEAEAWLLERRSAVHPYHAAVRRAVDLARSTRFRIGVGELCDRLGLSNRHLIAQFRDVVGLTPKTALRIERFHAVIESLRGQTDPDWARLAHQLGFADQSHLIREFHRFAGVTPTAFITRRTPDHAHVHVS